MALDDRALMLAYELFEQTRDAYRQEWRERRRKKNEKGTNPYLEQWDHNDKVARALLIYSGCMVQYTNGSRRGKLSVVGPELTGESCWM